MGKKKNRDRRSDDRHANQGFVIPESAEKMKKLNTFTKYWDKHKKKNDFDTKADAKDRYISRTLEYLPEVVRLIVRYGHVHEVQEIKHDLYAPLSDKGVVKAIKEAIKDKDEIENLELFPIVIRDMISEAQKIKQQIIANGGDPDGDFNLNYMIKLSRKILKKKINKMMNDGIDEDVAFDVLSIIPDKSVLEDKQINYKVRQLMAVLYESAKTKEIDFGKVIRRVIPEKYLPTVFLMLLLERKDKYASFNENQKKFFIQINEWLFYNLEQQKQEFIESVLKSYVETRKRDASQNRDADRRYFIKSLPEDEYERITAVVKHMIEERPEIEKFF